MPNPNNNTLLIPNRNAVCVFENLAGGLEIVDFLLRIPFDGDESAERFGEDGRDSPCREGVSAPVPHGVLGSSRSGW